MNDLWIVLKVLGAFVGVALIVALVAKIAWGVYQVATADVRDDGPMFRELERREAEEREAAKRSAENKIEE